MRDRDVEIEFEFELGAFARSWCLQARCWRVIESDNWKMGN